MASLIDRQRQQDDAGLLDDALADAVRRTGASAGGVYLWDESAQALGLTVLCGVPVEVAWPWRRVPLGSPVPVSDAVREDRLVWVGSQDDLARAYPRAAASLPYRFALAAAPMHGRKRCRGALMLLWPASHPADATRRERSHIAAVARRIGRLLEDSAPQAVPAEPRLTSVAPADDHPRDDRPFHAAMDYLDRLPEGALGLDLEGRITFVTGPTESMLGLDAGRLRGTRPWQSLPWLDTSSAEDDYRTAVISRDPVEFTALRPPDDWLHFRLYPDAGGISVRITHAPEPGTTQPGATARFPSSAPPHAARSGRLYQLVHLAAALTETVGVRDVVEFLTHQVLPAFGADGLVLSAADAGRLKITGHHGYDQHTIDRLDGLPLDTDLTPAGHALSHGIPSFFASPRDMALHYPRAPRISDKQAWAFLPLIVSDRPVGCCILSYARPHTFDADERAVLTSLAGLIAQALDRARLYDTARDLARGLQQTLLPRRLPALPGLETAARYLPASHGMDVGGDFYDVIRIGPSTVAAVIGDVQGHNVAAAALMGQVRTAIHTATGNAPSQVLARTSQVLVDLDSDLLVSCLYAYIDLARHEAVMASAGHPPPLIHQPGRSPRVVELDPGPLLGIDPGLAHPDTTLTLAPGTTLALFTDGLIETPGTDADQVLHSLAQELGRLDGRTLEYTLGALLQHARPTAHYTDDIAMLLLRTAAR
ncbi:SpoIIE family protein phosphatase [Streptomyces sp. NPDC085614]|uniref:SpoIIE family protein phosphatase n=1 Tax=Streptomyces sp. NPDC085614 TaxID=3365733 RepID=UPI0037D6D452